MLIITYIYFILFFIDYFFSLKIDKMSTNIQKLNFFAKNTKIQY